MVWENNMTRAVSSFMVSLIVLSVFVSSFSIQVVRAAGTIYIRADGSIDPPTAPISTVDNVTYTLIGNITSDADGIVVERSHIIIDGSGYTLQGIAQPFMGLDLTGRINVTIRNMRITAFSHGVWLDSSSNTSVIGNTITANSFEGIGLYSSSFNAIRGNTLADNGQGIWVHPTSSYNRIRGNNLTANDGLGVWLDSSSNTSVTGNTLTGNERGVVLYYSANTSICDNAITGNRFEGIGLHSSDHNTICANNITANGSEGVWLDSSDHSTIRGNNITHNDCGVLLFSASNNKVYHNNFAGNTPPVSSYTSTNLWDAGYPTGGNYWSDYVDVDAFKGPDQDEPGSDGVWDLAYGIDVDNQDRYPLTTPFGWFPAGDVDGDRDVDIYDIVRIAGAYAAAYPDPRYDRLCDLDLDGDIDIFDIVAAASRYGDSW
jgi:parallel beta-helix repeat protein